MISRIIRFIQIRSVSVIKHYSKVGPMCECLSDVHE